MNKKIIYIYLLLAATAGTVCAQSSNGVIPTIAPRGYLMQQGAFGVTDMLRLSQYNAGFSTARSSAMGGAFTSLGADLSSMSLNPAGLGMYLSSEVSLSPTLTIGQMENKAVGGVYGNDNSRTRFGMSNLGVALNLYQSSGALTSFTFGFGYNKLADFNYRSMTDMPVSNTSIGDVFLNQLRGINPDALLEKNEPWQNLSTLDWGAALAYKSYFVDVLADNTDSDNPYKYYLPTVAPNATASHLARTLSRGSIGEYSIAGGFNFNNRVYFGVSIGIQDLFLKQTINYDEVYSNNEEAHDPASYMLFDQHLKVTGTAVNFKLGLVARPIDGLRIGVAIHTPSIVSIEREYSASMHTEFVHPKNGVSGETSVSGINVPRYEFTTPTRLLTGISYTFGTVAILSADYERTWYNGMRLSDTDSYAKDDFKAEIKQQFKGANTFRVGAEFRPLPQLSVRAGYANQGSMLQDDGNVYDIPVSYQTTNISLGLGYRFTNHFSLDMTYVRMQSKYTMYDLFYFNGYDNEGNDLYNSPIQVGGIDQKLSRHNVIVSLNFRF